MLFLASLCSSLIQLRIVVYLLLLFIKENYLYHTLVCTKLLQVIIKGFTWVVLVEKPTLEAHKNSKSSSLCHILLLIHSSLFFSSCLGARQVKIIIYQSYLLAGNFLCLHRNFPSLFLVFCSSSSKLWLADIAGQRHISRLLAAYNTQEASKLALLELG